MRITSNRENTLEKAICQKAVAQFQTAIREWDQSPISEERRNKRKENINRIAGRGRVFITALENEIEYYLLPLITKLIQIELDLRVANHVPFTEERITALKAYLRNLVKANWRYIVLQAYEETITNVVNHNHINRLHDYQEDELNKMRDKYLEIKPERLFDIIDTKLQDAFAESVLHAQRWDDARGKQINSSNQIAADISVKAPDFQANKPRRHFLVRVTVGGIFAVMGYGVLFLPEVRTWTWLQNHPNRIGLYLADIAIVSGITWAIIDSNSKRRGYILGSIILGVMLVVIQIIGK
jgi:hypothetical protein